MIELVGGITAALLGLYIYAHVAVKAAAIQTGEGASGQTMITVFLILAVPGLVIAIGTYLQAMHHKNWALALIFIAGGCNLILMGLNARFAFAYSGDSWGQGAVFLDLALVLFILLAAFFTGLTSTLSRS